MIATHLSSCGAVTLPLQFNLDAIRLQPPQVPSRYWKVVGVLAVAALVPIALFLLLLSVLKG